MKHNLVALLTMFLVMPAMATEEWKSYIKNGEVEVLYRYNDCHDEANGLHQQKILLKFVNLKGKAVELKYAKQLTYNKQTTRGDVHEFVIKLAPNATLQGDCATKNNALFIFSKHLDFSSTQLEKFELNIISVKPAQ